jgi:hypothetical protein
VHLHTGGMLREQQWRGARTQEWWWQQRSTRLTKQYRQQFVYTREVECSCEREGSSARAAGESMRADAAAAFVSAVASLGERLSLAARQRARPSACFQKP